MLTRRYFLVSDGKAFTPPVKRWMRGLPFCERKVHSQGLELLEGEDNGRAAGRVAGGR